MIFVFEFILQAPGIGPENTINVIKFQSNIYYSYTFQYDNKTNVYDS